MVAFKLPDIGEGLAEAELLEWIVEVGDHVDEGQPIAEVATDKVTVEIPSPCDGIVRELPWNPRDVIAVGAVLAVIESEGDEAAPPGGTEQSAPPSKMAPTAESAPPQRGAQMPGGRVVAAPSTRRLAHQLGVDLTGMIGSGPGGRILVTDVQAGAAGEPVSSDASSAGPGQAFESVPLTGVRLVSARRMELSARTYATATSTFMVDGDGILRLRALLSGGEHDEKIGTLAIMTRSVASALMVNRRFNARIDEDNRTLLIGRQVDLAVAVATDDGLTVPVIRAADTKTVSQLNQEIRALSERAREGRLNVSDLEGGTFTLSSTGGLEQAALVSTTPLISPPQVATLWLSRIVDAPRVKRGVLEAGPVLRCSISFDHRFIDGAEVAAFINDLTSYLENPERAMA